MSAQLEQISSTALAPAQRQQEITQAELKALLNYDPLTGIFTRKIRTSNVIRVGQPAGYLCHGYIRIKLNAVPYAAHRLAWLYVHGSMPSDCIDHINGDASDNRIANLRKASHAENMRNFGMKRNNTSGFKGVTWHAKTGKWRAACRVNGKNNSLGLFETKELASAAFVAFSAQQFGEFFNKEGIKNGN